MLKKRADGSDGRAGVTAGWQTVSCLQLRYYLKSVASAFAETASEQILIDLLLFLFVRFTISDR